MARKTFRKVITKPETLEKINPKNLKLKEQFIKNKKLTTSETTIKNYASDLDIFFSYLVLESSNQFFIDLKKFDFIEFFVYAQEELKWGASRSNRMRSTLSSLSNFVERVLDEKYPDFRNLVVRAVDTVPKDERREKSIFSDDEVQELLNHFSNVDKQIGCWLGLAVSSGMRFSELLRVKVSTIETAEDAFKGLFLYTHPIQSKGRGGKRKDNKYILKEEFMKYYLPWKEERHKILEDLGVEEHDSLFIKKDGSPAVEGTIRSWVKQIDEWSDKDFYVHSLRHFITTKLSLNGIPRELIQAIMRWKSSDMVALYDDSEIQDREWDELESLRK